MAAAYSLVRKDRNDGNVGGTTSLRIDTIIKNRTAECTATVQTGWPSLHSIQPSLARCSRIETPQSRKHRKPFTHDIFFVSVIVTSFPSKKYGVSIQRPSGNRAHVEYGAQNRLVAIQRQTAPRGITFTITQVADRYTAVSGEVLSGIV